MKVPYFGKSGSSLISLDREYLDDDDSALLVGTLNGAIVAMGGYTAPSEWKTRSITLNEHTAELTRMRVDPAFQGLGLGTAVYDELEQWARADGYRRFVLDTGAENDTARRFYERLGFECRREVAVSFEETVTELALYKRSIDSSG